MARKKNHDNAVRFLDAVERGDIEKLYLDGWTYKKVAQEYSVSLEWVRKQTRPQYKRATTRRRYSETLNELLSCKRLKYLTMKW